MVLQSCPDWDLIAMADGWTISPKTFKLLQMISAISWFWVHMTTTGGSFCQEISILAIFREYLFRDIFWMLAWSDRVPHIIVPWSLRNTCCENVLCNDRPISLGFILFLIFVRGWGKVNFFWQIWFFLGRLIHLNRLLILHESAKFFVALTLSAKTFPYE